MCLYDLLCVIDYDTKITIFWRDTEFSGYVFEFLDNLISGFPIAHHYIVNEIRPDPSLIIFVRG